MQTDLRERYSSKNLTLKIIPKIGAAVHILTREGVAKIEADETAHLFQKSNSTRAYVIRVSLYSPGRRYSTPLSKFVARQDWVHLWKKLETVSTQIQEVEKETIDILTARVLDNYDNLLKTADALAELDVVMGLAELAQEKRWTKPTIDSRQALFSSFCRFEGVANTI